MHTYYTLAITNRATGSRYLHYYVSVINRRDSLVWYRHNRDYICHTFRTTSPRPLTTND